MALTQGALLTICQGGEVENPNLQILSFKKIAGSSSERYRLLVSDGMYSNSYAMLATQLNHFISDNKFSDYTIVRVNKLQCNTMQGKKVIIILDADVIRPGAQVGHKIGNPVAINADGTVNENERMAAQKAGKRIGNEQPEGQPIAKKPLQQSNNSVSKPSSMLQEPPVSGYQGGMVYPIASLTPYQNKWTIKARVTNKSDIRRWSNARGEGHLFSMDLIDESGEIRATAFKEQCDKYYNMIEIGKVFYFTSGTLKAANKQYSNLNNDYEMTFRDSTEVFPCTDEGETTNIPTITFNFCQISQLNASLKDTTVDIIGVVKSASDVANITSSRTGKELTKRDIVLVDKSLTEVGLTLWGSTAEKFEAEGNPVVAFKGVRVSDYNGVSLSTLSASVVQVNPDLSQCHDLRGWYDSEGATAATTSITQSGPRSNMDTSSALKSFGEVKKDNLGMNGDKPEYYSTYAYVTLIPKDKALYQACANISGDRTCNKKVQDQGDGTYRCEKCNNNSPTFNWRLIVKMSMADSTDNQWINCFQEQAEAMLGMSSEDLGNLFVNDRAQYDSVFSAATFKRWNIRVRAKADYYNDEQRVQHGLASATPISYPEYIKKMVAELEEAGMEAPQEIKEKYS